ncbi:MAG: elongation factor G [Clostridia bacterium]|nr:elongation factor G [Clostridia bacterium]
MADYTTKNIRNIAFFGHGGSGKTSLAEAMLYLTKGTDRLGKVPDGNTVCDYDPEEIKRGFSLTLTTAPIEWEKVKINVIDTPGYLDFAGEAIEAARVADASVILVDGKAGLEVGAELGWEYSENEKIPRAIFVNKCDDPDFDFDRVFTELHDTFGISVCPVFFPVKNGSDVVMVDLTDMSAFKYDDKGNRSSAEMTDAVRGVAEQYKDAFNEAIAETSEELLEKYFGGEEITKEEALNALNHGITSGAIVPVYCGSAVKLWGVRALMDVIAHAFPSFLDRKQETVVEGGAEKKIDIVETGDPSLFVFKTIADPFVGKMSFFKVMQGTLKRDMTLKNLTTGVQNKMAHIYTNKGKKQTEVEQLNCGDIGVVNKIADINTNDTLTVSGSAEYRKIEFPHPYMTKAILPASKGDEDKISQGVTKLLEEDPTLVYENNAETKQMTISGMGDIHLDVVVAKLKSRYSTSVVLETPRLAYRETIKGSSDVEGKHKKQSGGSGQYGHVKMRFSHGEDEGLTFTQSVVGGTVPKGYYPAVEKGLLEAMQKGVLAGYPVVHLAADLYDGSYHPVDSNEISFKLAARLAYKAGLPLANPIILEPIGTLKVAVPDSLVGDVMGDLNKRRGRVLGMNPYEKKSGYTVIEADVPAAEMMDYTISLRAMSQGRGRFDFIVDRYEEAPANVAQKIIAEAKVEED